MHSVSATLETAQSAASRKPYIHMAFTSYDGLTTYDLSTDSVAYGNRILLIDHSEEPYNESAIVILRNYPRNLPDLTGYWTEIGYGDVTGSGNEYAATARLWVKHQQYLSAGGRVLVILELEGMWAKLRETLMRIGTPPYYIAKATAGDFGGATTPYDIISYILVNEIDPAMSLAALAQDDSIIDTYTPDFQINSEEKFNDAGYIIRTLIKMTKSFLRPKPSMQFEVVYPQTTDAVVLTFYSNQSPYFYEYTERSNVVVPNRIFVFANAGSDLLWSAIITAQADNSASQTKYGVVPDIALAPGITTQGNADTRAAAILARQTAEVMAGRLIIPHDCQLELYDRVAIQDERGE